MGIAEESLITTAETTRLIPPGRNGKPTNSSTIIRWMTRGVQGIRLEGVRYGARWLTSREALARFSAALTAKTLAQAGAASQAPCARDNAATNAEERQLDALRI